MDDLLRSGAVPDANDSAFWSETAILAATPPPDDAVFLPEEPDGSLAMLRDGFAGPLEAVLGIPIRADHIELIHFGRAAVAAAAQLALTRLRNEGAERILVLGVDSLLEPLLLQSLASDDRLKTSENPTGLSPGEGAACFLLETPESAQRRGASVIAKAVNVVTDRDVDPEDDSPPGAGRALARCLRQVLDRLSPSEPFSGDLVLDLNGEAWRAIEWGSAQVQLHGRLGAAREHLPCSSLGDTGVAHAAIGACFAIHLLQRGVAQSGWSLVVSSSEHGEAGVIALGPPA
jgi:3-oxoacyl-[acyl-carrier-protein] synthase-1